jgi:hypothetical protein
MQYLKPIIDNSIFLVGALIFPSFIFAINWVIRHVKDYPPSTTADLALFLVLYDANVILAKDLVADIVKNSSVKETIVPLHLSLLAFCLFYYICCVFIAEPKVIFRSGSLLSKDTPIYKKNFFIIMFFWFISFSLSFFHVWLIICK